MEGQEVYDKLAEKYELVGSKHFMDMIKVLMTPDEGEIVLALSEPATPHELAQKMNLDETKLAEKLDNLGKRGLLFRGKTQFVAWKDSHQLNARTMFSKDEYIPKEVFALRRQDERYASSPHSEINRWLKRYEATGKQLARVLPARLALAASPKIKPDQILWYEDVAQIFKKAEMIGVTDCNCRRIYGRCDKPTLTCFHMGKNIIEYETGRGGRMKAVSVEEAIALSDEAEKKGLIHETPVNNASLPGVLCNCCTDCCSVFEPALESNNVNKVVSPSRFRAAVDQDLCTGCQVCIERCKFDAIEMTRPFGSKKMKSSVVADKCLGCGACVVGCKFKALTLELVRPPEHIPEKPATPVTASATYNIR
jgi:ferredoxin